MQHRTETVQQLESEHGERTQRGYAIETELRENRERLSQITMEIDRAQARRRHNEERCAELTGAGRFRGGRVGAGTASAERARSGARFQPAVARFRRGGFGRGAKRSGPIASRKRGVGRQLWRNSERQQEESRVAIFDTVSSVSRLRNQLAQAEERLAGADREDATAGSGDQQCELPGRSLWRTARPTGAGIRNRHTDGHRDHGRDRASFGG